MPSSGLDVLECDVVGGETMAPTGGEDTGIVATVGACAAIGDC